MEFFILENRIVSAKDILYATPTKLVIGSRFSSVEINIDEFKKIKLWLMGEQPISTSFISTDFVFFDTKNVGEINKQAIEFKNGMRFIIDEDKFKKLKEAFWVMHELNKNAEFLSSNQRDNSKV